MTNSSQGYIIQAFGDIHYKELALACACSIRLNDPKRDICLLTDSLKDLPPYFHQVFTDIFASSPSEPYDGSFSRKFILDQESPYGRNIHVDADCLLVRKGMNAFWERFAGLPACFPSQRKESGTHWNGAISIDNLIAKGLVDSVYLLNSGVFYYESSKSKSNRFFETVRSLYLSFLDDPSTGLSYFARPGQVSDEPIFGAAISRHPECSIPFDYRNLLQLTSPNTSMWSVDYVSSTFSAKKGGLHDTTGQFIHFCEMTPLAHYLQGIIYYRSFFSLPVLIASIGKNKELRITLSTDALEQERSKLEKLPVESARSLRLSPA
ncbi:hypothetical protein [Cyanobium sp. Copco_Reservoir_LC18]|uniref:hypothetical protein n=1 Tax=Cyanobium sp. Copco_Reservoir_LC18 TaxID=1328305 RepID=UPI001357E66C|nr:hypothetical protein [Cyanobium sp. Copco_Reservoir_LC18]